MRDANFGIATGAFLDERDDWPAAIRRATEEAWSRLELTAITEELFRSLCVYLASSTAHLAAFTRVSVHAPAVLDSSAKTVARLVVDSEISHDLIFHPDVFGHEDALAGLEGQAVFENMDVNKSFGRTPSELTEVFERFPAAGFCLDVAHVWTID